MSAEPSLSEPEAAPRCARHPDALAIGACTRCGTFGCEECLKLFDGRLTCERCELLLIEKSAPSPRAKLALWLGIAGINFTLLPGIAALFLAHRELAAIARGDAPIAGRPYARAARLLGWLCAAALAAIALYAANAQ